MNSFFFTYEFSQDGYILAEAEGECTACEDGTLDPWLFGTLRTQRDVRPYFAEHRITPKGQLMSDVLIYLQREYADQIADIRQDHADE
jgi:hypothetical protein